MSCNIGKYIDAEECKYQLEQLEKLVQLEKKMNTFIQHFPTFVDIRTPPQVHYFSTTEELLALPIIKENYSSGETFSHFAMSGYMLMSVSDGGKHWWVCGRISKPVEVDLPKWEAGK